MYTASKERYTTMEYDHCGNSGLMLPKVSLGLWHNFGDTVYTLSGRGFGYFWKESFTFVITKCR